MFYKLCNVFISTAMIVLILMADVIAESERDYIAYGFGFGLNTTLLTEDMAEINKNMNDGEGPEDYTGCFINLFASIFPVNQICLYSFMEGAMAYSKYAKREDGSEFPSLYKLSAGFLPGIAFWDSGNSEAYLLNGGITYNYMFFDDYASAGFGFRIKFGRLIHNLHGEWICFGLFYDYFRAEDNNVKIGGASINLCLDLVF